MENRLRHKLEKSSDFLVLLELASGPRFNFAPIENFLKSYKETKSGVLPSGFDFVGITVPENPSGVANIEPADVLGRLRAKDLLGDLDFLPHISCKDANRDNIVSTLVKFRDAGVETILALTGDKPAKSKGVFELDSILLLQLLTDMNRDAYLRSRPESLGNVPQFFSGAAVSPFKYTEPSQMQQYYKMEKKMSCGAEFFITQMGWDWRKSAELFRYMQDERLEVPVIANVYFLSNMTAAPRLMHDGKLMGCFVSDELFNKVYSETVEEHIERAAQQVAMYKSMGAAGVDISGVSDLEIFSKIFERAGQIGDGWQEYKDNLYWPKKGGFYLYDEQGQRVKLSKPRKKFRQRFFNFFHDNVLEPETLSGKALKGGLAVLGMDKGKGVCYKLFNAFEKSFKYLFFDCESCGDCYLPENFGYCSLGGCEKGLSNPPCGDATIDGKCGNDLEKDCVGELIYNAAAAQKDGRERLRKALNKKRNPELLNTSSIVNYLFKKDHTMGNPVTLIGESIHASIPKSGKVMKELAGLGKDAYTNSSGPLNYIRTLVDSQVDDGADYIEVNLDAFSEDDPQTAVDMMIEYARLVRKWSRSVPICIDSSDDNVLIAGLKEWYNCSEKVKPPLLNSVKTYTMDKILPLKKDFDFSFIGLLISEEKPSGPGGSHSVEELYSLARQIFETATGKYGFKPGEIYFDTTVFPLAIDMPMEPGVPGFTYRAFQTIRKIKTDERMKGVHCSLGISNAVRDLPGRSIGVCRAYLAKAMEYGLDTAIVNTAHHYGRVAPAPELLELVDVFVKMDGSAEKTNKSMSLMSEFCKLSRKPSKR